MKRFVVSLFLILLATGLLAQDAKADAERKRLTQALKAGNAAYFRTVSWVAFQKANEDLKGTTIESECYREPAVCVQALLGAFDNRDAKVRAAAYGELTFRHHDNAAAKIRGHRSGPSALASLKAAIARKTETDPAARAALAELAKAFPLGVPDALARRDARMLATMSTDAFKKTNVGLKNPSMAYLIEVVQVGDRNAYEAVRLCIDAVALPMGNVETQREVGRFLGEAAYMLRFGDGFLAKNRKALGAHAGAASRRTSNAEFKNLLGELARDLSS